MLRNILKVLSLSPYVTPAPSTRLSYDIYHLTKPSDVIYSANTVPLVLLILQSKFDGIVTTSLQSTLNYFTSKPTHLEQ